MTWRTAPPFRADHVGSLLRPPALLQARADHADGRLAADELRAVEDGAVRDAVRMQEAIGLEAATDGELRRGSWHMDFIYQVAGQGALAPVRGRPAPRDRRTDAAAQRTRARDRGRPTGAALPADHRARLGPGRRVREPGPLEAPGARAGAAGGVHRDRGGVGADRPARFVGPRTVHPGGGGLAPPTRTTRRTSA